MSKRVVKKVKNPSELNSSTVEFVRGIKYYADDSIKKTVAKTRKSKCYLSVVNSVVSVNKMIKLAFNNNYDDYIAIVTISLNKIVISIYQKLNVDIPEITIEFPVQNSKIYEFNASKTLLNKQLKLIINVHNFISIADVNIKANNCLKFTIKDERIYRTILSEKSLISSYISPFRYREFMYESIDDTNVFDNSDVIIGFSAPTFEMLFLDKKRINKTKVAIELTTDQCTFNLYSNDASTPTTVFTVDDIEQEIGDMAISAGIVKYEAEDSIVTSMFDLSELFIARNLQSKYTACFMLFKHTNNAWRIIIMLTLKDDIGIVSKRVKT